MRQLDLEGAEHEAPRRIAPAAGAPERLFSFPEGMRGQQALEAPTNQEEPTMPLAYDGAPRPITITEAQGIADREYGYSRDGNGGWIVTHMGADGGRHMADTAYSEGSARGACEERRRRMVRRIMAGECQHTIFYDRARDTFYCG